MSTAGQEAVDLAASAGLILDPWEQLVLDQSLGERADGRWSAFEVGLVVPRQSGKGAILEARVLAGLFLFGERLQLWSAHEFKTASEAFLRVRALVDGTADLSRRVRKIRTSHGDEGIELITGQRLRFVARSKGSGRGFTGDLVILDEAFQLLAAAVGALLPTMSARPNPQLWYTSSAPRRSSEVLKKLCRRGRSGTSARLAFFEWCAALDPELKPDEREAQVRGLLDDRDAWAAANPALGIRITEEFVENERDAMDDEEFGRERLGIWYDEAADRLIPDTTWDLVNSPDARPTGALVLVPDVNMERSAAAIVAVGRGTVVVDGTEREIRVLEVVEHRPGVAWLVARCEELDESWHPTWAVDGRSTAPVAGFVPKLRDAGLDVTEVEPADMTAACGDIFDAIADRTVMFRRHPSMDTAIGGADQRFSGDSWVWDRRGDVDISPLMAGTVGLWALEAGGEADFFTI